MKASCTVTVVVAKGAGLDAAWAIRKALEVLIESQTIEGFSITDWREGGR